MLGRPGPPKAGRWGRSNAPGGMGVEHTPPLEALERVGTLCASRVGMAVEKRWKMALECLSIAVIICRQNEPFSLVRWRRADVQAAKPRFSSKPACLASLA